MSTTDISAGYRLRRAIDEAIGRSDRIRNVTELCEVSGVNRNTFYSWTNGTATPSMGKLLLLAEALEMPVATLLAAYEGRSEMEPTVEQALSRLADEVGAQNARLDQLLRKLDLLTTNAVALSVAQALTERIEGQPTRRGSRTRSVEDVVTEVDEAAGQYGLPRPIRRPAPQEEQR